LLCFDKQIQNLICVLFSQKAAAAAAAAPSLSQATTHLQRLVLQGLRGVDLLLLLLAIAIADCFSSHLSFFLCLCLSLSLSLSQAFHIQHFTLCDL
jgi:hypothetical protein